MPTTAALPAPSKWGIDADISSRPIVRGELIIHSIVENKVRGTINFRGVPIPIEGMWNDHTQQLRFDSPFAMFTGRLSTFDDTSIRVRHLILRGSLTMKPPSVQAGQTGTWIATTDLALNEIPSQDGIAFQQATQQLPPVGAFLTSGLLYNKQRR